MRTILFLSLGAEELAEGECTFRKGAKYNDLYAAVYLERNGA